MPPNMMRALTLALGLAVTLGTANAQLATKTLDPEFASLVLAAQEQHRVAAPTPTVARRAGFNRRQQTSATPSTTLVTEAPDSTCGFLSGSPGNAITCENGGLCSWAPAAVPAIICADASKGISFSGKLQCFERSLATNTAICDDVSQSNAYNLLCTAESAAFCRTYLYPSNVTDFRCASTSVASPQSVAFTYSGQEDRVFTTSTWGDEPVELSSATARASSSSSDGSSTSESSTTSDTGTPTPVPAPSGGGTNVGAIVGGVVGGVAVLALIGFGIYFMRRHSAKKDAQAGGQPQPQTPHDIQPQPVQQYYPAPGASPAEVWKGGATSPVHTNLTTPINGAPYDDVSDIQSTRMSEMHSPGPGQPTNVPGTIHEVDNDPRGHHRGGLHEMG